MVLSGVDDAGKVVCGEERMRGMSRCDVKGGDVRDVVTRTSME